MCCSHKQSDVSRAATEFLSYLMLACFHYTGSLSKLSVVFITVFDDVLTHILESNREYIRYNSDEIALLLPLQMNLIRIRDAHLVELKSSNYAREKGGPPKNKPAYASAVVTLMNNLLLLFRATGYLRRHVTHPVGHDWLATNMLDGPFDDRSTAYMHFLRNARKAVTTQNVVQVDLEAVMEVFAEAAEIFDPISLPRFRMRYESPSFDMIIFFLSFVFPLYFYPPIIPQFHPTLSDIKISVFLQFNFLFQVVRELGPIARAKRQQVRRSRNQMEDIQGIHKIKS